MPTMRLLLDVEGTYCTVQGILEDELEGLARNNSYFRLRTFEALTTEESFTGIVLCWLDILGRYPTCSWDAFCARACYIPSTHISAGSSSKWLQNP